MYDFRRVRQSPQNQVPAIALQSFSGHHHSANLGTIIHTPLISLRNSLILLISTKERALGRKTAVRLSIQDLTHYNQPRVKNTLTE